MLSQQQKMLSPTPLATPLVTPSIPRQSSTGSTGSNKAKVRWNVEPRLSIMRNAVKTVLNGANTTDVAGRFGIPARTLRRYVANAKRKQGGGQVSAGKGDNRKGGGMRRKSTKKRGSQQAMEMINSVTINKDAPIAGPIQPLLRSNEMEVLGKKRTRTTSLELFLEALAPVAMRHKARGNSGENGGSVASKNAAAFNSGSQQSNTNSRTASFATPPAERSPCICQPPPCRPPPSRPR